jgi:hypothetical protein
MTPGWAALGRSVPKGLVGKILVGLALRRITEKNSSLKGIWAETNNWIKWAA